MPRLTAIEIAIPHGIMPNLLLVRVHTDDGLVGCGETYYTPHAIAALIHDCTGPLTLFAGLHLAAASTNVVFQETVRAHVRTLYGQLVDCGPVIERGAALLPEGPGLGTRFHDALFAPGIDAYRRSG